MNKIKKIYFKEAFFLLIIISYAWDFGIAKYALTWIYILLDVSFSIRKDNGIYKIGKNGKKFLHIFYGILVLIFITAFLQLKNGFHSYSINEIIFLLTPIIFVICYTKKMNKNEIDLSMRMSFIVFFIAFIYRFYTEFSISNLLSISFVDSYSPFESEWAYLFVVYECYFIYSKNKKYTILSLILCILSFKRLSCIVGILIFLSTKFINIYKKFGNKLIIIVTLFYILLPVLTCVAINNDIEGYLYTKYRISLDELTLTRTRRLRYVLETDQIKYGLGSTTTFLTQKLNSISGATYEQRNLHNDLVKFYVECGLLGLSIIIYAYLKNFSLTRISFILMSYILLECYVNHLFGAGTTYFWIVTYIFLASQEKIKREEKNE